MQAAARAKRRGGGSAMRGRSLDPGVRRGTAVGNFREVPALTPLTRLGRDDTEKRSSFSMRG